MENAAEDPGKVAQVQLPACSALPVSERGSGGRALAVKEGSPMPVPLVRLDWG